MTQRELAEHIYNMVLADQQEGEPKEATVLLVLDILHTFARQQRDADANLADQWEGTVAAQISDAIRGQGKELGRHVTPDV